MCPFALCAYIHLLQKSSIVVTQSAQGCLSHYCLSHEVCILIKQSRLSAAESSLSMLLAGVCSSLIAVLSADTLAESSTAILSSCRFA